ncbi:MAG: hypothetical protein C4532_10730 [Candidatus Abyssobacteria bacterium SURF_17]|uniref:Uncharacterized protein n=1 Tax=Candidatus Abyssobacteria bacterium SURF_17 TaxID=2093361 RepID=A0A419EXX3_9BACT|nr:MAG: hypothetical protein C4532_10730 [Candidatus Abyssubacteria bacterium SURF_17]
MSLRGAQGRRPKRRSNLQIIWDCFASLAMTSLSQITTGIQAVLKISEARVCRIAMYDTTFDMTLRKIIFR